MNLQKIQNLVHYQTTSKKIKLSRNEFINNIIENNTLKFTIQKKNLNVNEIIKNIIFKKSRDIVKIFMLDD